MVHPINFEILLPMGCCYTEHFRVSWVTPHWSLCIPWNLIRDMQFYMLRAGIPRYFDEKTDAERIDLQRKVPYVSIEPRTQEIGCACIFGQLEKQAGGLEDLNNQPWSFSNLRKDIMHFEQVVYCIVIFVWFFPGAGGDISHFCWENFGNSGLNTNSNTCTNETPVYFQ